MEGKYRRLVLASAAAATILIFGLSAYKVWRSQKKPKQIKLKVTTLDEDLANLGSVKFYKDEMILFESFAEIFKIIRKHAKI